LHALAEPYLGMGLDQLHWNPCSKVVLV
jgi:hypothetical protein